ncbi:MAG: hypothetical protein H0T11_04955 [Chthoniobacterales bacterium]|nr:hypothetical protein [Chthoniobacterales bacterium]
MSPFDLLCIFLAFTACTAVVYRIAEQRRRSAIRALAAQWEMHFSAGDPFRLANRISLRLPVPGAASVRLRDLIYGIEGDFYRYYFTVEYTLHAVSARTRVQRVATFVEPRACSDAHIASKPTLCESETGLPLLDQYVQLKECEDTAARASDASAAALPESVVTSAAQSQG